MRKCVELFYRNWPGLTLSSPIRFSTADRRTKSISWNVEWRVKKCKKMTSMKCYRRAQKWQIDPWIQGGEGIEEPPKWPHFFTFGARASAKVCRVIFPKLKGSDFELSHTILKCWQTHEIHDLESRVKSERVQKDYEHEVLSTLSTHKMLAGNLVWWL